MNTRWFGVTWMRSTDGAPLDIQGGPRLLFVWVRFGRKRKLKVAYR